MQDMKSLVDAQVAALSESAILQLCSVAVHAISTDGCGMRTRPARIVTTVPQLAGDLIVKAMLKHVDQKQKERESHGSQEQL